MLTPSTLALSITPPPEFTFPLPHRQIYPVCPFFLVNTTLSILPCLSLLPCQYRLVSFTLLFFLPVNIALSISPCLSLLPCQYSLVNFTILFFLPVNIAQSILPCLSLLCQYRHVNFKPSILSSCQYRSVNFTLFNLFCQSSSVNFTPSILPSCQYHPVYVSQSIPSCQYHPVNFTLSNHSYHPFPPIESLRCRFFTPPLLSHSNLAPPLILPPHQPCPFSITTTILPLSLAFLCGPPLSNLPFLYPCIPVNKPLPCLLGPLNCPLPYP